MNSMPSPATMPSEGLQVQEDREELCQGTDTHPKRRLMGRAAAASRTGAQLHFGPWARICSGGFDGRQSKGGRQNHRPTNRIRKASSFCLLPPIISYTTEKIRFLQGASYAAYGRRSTIICLGEQAQQSAGRDSSGVESHVGHLRGMCTEIQSRRAPDEGGPGSFYLPEMRTSHHSAQGGCRPGPPARGIADSHSRNFILSAKPSPALCWFKERNA